MPKLGAMLSYLEAHGDLASRLALIRLHAGVARIPSRLTKSTEHQSRLEGSHDQQARTRKKPTF